MTLNIDAFTELRDFLKTQVSDKTFNHRRWVDQIYNPGERIDLSNKRHICRTSACIAGWGCILWNLAEPSTCPDKLSDGTEADRVFGFGESPSQAAGDKLGLSEYERGILFYPGDIQICGFAPPSRFYEIKGDFDEEGYAGANFVAPVDHDWVCQQRDDGDLCLSDSIVPRFRPSENDATLAEAIRFLDRVIDSGVVSARYWED